MGVHSTVVFTDLYGSTGAFESLGNVQATKAVTQVTQWIASVIESHQGRVVKMLGDGVLALFSDNRHAVNAVVEIQRKNQKRMLQLPEGDRMPIRIGLAGGDVELVAGDCYGDAVNVAARLSDLSGPNQIWVNQAALAGAIESGGVRFRTLGPISIRGRAEPCEVLQVDWQEDVASDFLTMQAYPDPQLYSPDKDVLGRQIELTWVNTRQAFKSFELPVHLGRVQQSDFVISDPRVSRTHARIDWRNGSVILVDLSSYGCWVRFSGGGSDLLLRRKECVLHGHGEIALGSSFTDLSAPIISFSVT